MQEITFRAPNSSINTACRVYKDIGGIIEEITDREYNLTTEGFTFRGTAEELWGDYEIRCNVDGNECVYNRTITPQMVNPVTPTPIPPTPTPTPIPPTPTPTPSSGPGGPIGNPTPTPTPVLPTPTPIPQTPTPTPVPIYQFNVFLSPIGSNSCTGGEGFTLYGRHPNFASNSVFYIEPIIDPQAIWYDSRILEIRTEENLVYEWDGELILGVLFECTTDTEPTPDVTIEMRRYLDGQGETDNPNSLVFDHSVNKKLLCIDENNGVPVTIHTFLNVQDIVDQTKFHTSSAGGFETLVGDGLYTANGRLFRTINGRVTEIDECSNLTLDSYTVITGSTSDNTCNRNGSITASSTEVFLLNNPPKVSDVVYDVNPFNDTPSNIPPGFYSFSGRWFEVGNNSLVVNIGVCPEPTLTFVPTELNFLSGGGDPQSFNISSNVDWRISTVNDFITNINPTEGSNDGEVTISVTQNPPGSGPRSGWVDIQSIINNAPFNAGRVRILQEEFIPVLDVDIENIILPPEGASDTFTITSNETWTITTDGFTSDWLNITPTFGSGNQTVTVSALRNEETNRSGVITITNNGTGTSKTINVSQNRAYYLEVWYQGSQLSGATLDERTIFISRGSLYAEPIEIRSNITNPDSWRVAEGPPTSWLTVVTDQLSNNDPGFVEGFGTQMVYLKTLQNNSTGSPRSTSITIFGPNVSNINIRVTQQS